MRYIVSVTAGMIVGLVFGYWLVGDSQGNHAIGADSEALVLLMLITAGGSAGVLITLCDVAIPRFTTRRMFFVFSVFALILTLVVAQASLIERLKYDNALQRGRRLQFETDRAFFDATRHKLSADEIREREAQLDAEAAELGISK